MVPDQELVGLYEVAEMLGLSRPAVKYRANEHQDFPEALAHLRAGPVWSRGDIVAYALRASRSEAASRATRD